jgi:hypothetical protein
LDKLVNTDAAKKKKDKFKPTIDIRRLQLPWATFSAELCFGTAAVL